MRFTLLRRSENICFTRWLSAYPMQHSCTRMNVLYRKITDVSSR